MRNYARKGKLTVLASPFCRDARLLKIGVRIEVLRYGDRCVNRALDGIDHYKGRSLMATLQGVCKNCGSLIMFDDRDENCECVFCNCVFPSAEAIEIMNNPDGYTFPNEKYEPSTDVKRHTTTRVFSDDNIKNAIKRDELAAASGKDAALKKSEFEVSPNDVKAPAKTVSLIVGITAVVVLLVLIISVPLYNSRKDVKLDIEDNIDQVYPGISDEQFTVWGQTGQHAKLLIYEDISEDEAIEIFDRYCEVRGEARDKSASTKDVKVVIYSNGCIWTVTEDGAEAEEDNTEIKVETEEGD